MRRFLVAFSAMLMLASSAITAQTPPTLTIAEHDSELLLDLGPIDVPARNDRGVFEVAPQRVVVPIGGWIRGYSVEVVDRSGARLPQLLHHLYVIAPHKRELFSGDHLYIAAASGETEPLTLPRLFGYEMKKGDTLLVQAGISDPSGRRWEGLRVRVRFPRVGANSLIGAVAIYPFYVAVPAPQRADNTEIPPGRSESYWEGHPAAPGRILGLSGHAPTYGVRLLLEDRTAHKVIWDAHPDTNAAGQPRPIPIKEFVWTVGVGIWPDHLYRLTVTYNNPTSAPIPASGGWGVLGGVFMLERGAVWPSAGTTGQ